MLSTCTVQFARHGGGPGERGGVSSTHAGSKVKYIVSVNTVCDNLILIWEAEDIYTPLILLRCFTHAMGKVSF